MQIGLITEPVGHLPFDEALDLAQRLGLSSVEVATGHWSEAPHIDLAQVIASTTPRRVREQDRRRPLRLSALTAK